MPTSYEVGRPGSGNFVSYARQRYPNIPTEEALQQLLLEQQLSGGGGIDLPPIGGGAGGVELIIPMGPEDGAPITSNFQMPEALPWLNDSMPQINVPEPVGSMGDMPFADLSGVVPQGEMPNFFGPTFDQGVPGGSEFFDQIMNPPGPGFQVAPSDLSFTGTPAPSWAEPTPIPSFGAFPGMFAGGDPGSLSPLGGNPMGFGTDVTPDWGALPSGDQSLWTMPDYFSGGVNTGGSDISNFGGDLSLGGYIEPSSDTFLGMGGSDLSGAGVVMPQDLSQSPGEVFSGVQDPVPTFSEVDPLSVNPSGDPTVEVPTTSPDIPVPDGFGDLIEPAPIPDVPADPSPVTPDGTALPDENFAAAPPPDALPPGMNFGNATGVFAIGGPFSTSGPGPKFSSAPGYSFAPGSSFTIPGIPGTFQTTPSGQTFSTAIGMFGLGAMNAPSSGGAIFGGGYNRSWAGADKGFGDLGAIADRNAIKDAKNGVTEDIVYLAKPAKPNASTNWLMSQPTYKAPSGTYGGPSTAGSSVLALAKALALGKGKK